MTTPETPPLLDAAGRLAVSISCVHCGYNLRTLARDGVCPECATEISKSLPTAPLQLSPAEWLKCVAGGVRRLQLSAIGLATAVLIAVLIAIPAAIWFSGRGALVILLILSVVSGYLILTGARQISRIREDRSPQQVQAAHRIQAMLLAVFGMLAVAVVGSCAAGFVVAAIVLSAVVVMLAVLWMRTIEYVAAYLSFGNTAPRHLIEAPTLAFRAALGASATAMILTLALTSEFPMSLLAWIGVGAFAAAATLAWAYILVVLAESALALQVYARILSRLAIQARFREDSAEEMRQQV